VIQKQIKEGESTKYVNAPSKYFFSTYIYSHSEKYVQITSSKHQKPNNIKYQNSNVQNKLSGFEF